MPDVAEQVLKPVRKTLDLEEFRAGDGAGGADDCVAGAHHHRRVGIDRPRAFLQLAREAVLHAAKCGLLRLAQVEVREEAPYGDGEIADERLFDPAEPADEPRREPARNAVGE
jgi:hypothetical protein